LQIYLFSVYFGHKIKSFFVFPFYFFVFSHFKDFHFSLPALSSRIPSSFVEFSKRQSEIFTKMVKSQDKNIFRFRKIFAYNMLIIVK